MILTKNIVVDGQTIFSGERVAFLEESAKVQTPMTWLSEHQINLRIEKELREEHILSQRRLSLG